MCIIGAIFVNDGTNGQDILGSLILVVDTTAGTYPVGSVEPTLMEKLLIYLAFFCGPCRRTKACYRGMAQVALMALTFGTYSGL
jgi:hypothetical protein